MFRNNLLLAVGAAMVLSSSVAVSPAQEKDGAEALLEHTTAIYAKAEVATGAAKYRLMEDVRNLLDRIVDDYPGSDISVKILLGKEIGEIDIAALDEFLKTNKPEPAAAEASPRQPAEAEALFDSAVALNAETADAEPERRYRLMRSIRALLNRIVDEYPASDLAVQILLGGKVGPIDMLEVDRVLAEDPEGKHTEGAAVSSRGSDGGPEKEDGADRTADWPDDYLPNRNYHDAREAERSLRLTLRERREIQRRLSLIGLYTRGIDGIFGRGTREAIADWQYRTGFPDTGFLDSYQLGVLIKATENAFQNWLRHTRSDARRGRYTDSNGCLREADGRVVPNQSIRCDVKGVLGL